ncbi:MAG: hypothetical protein HC828_19060, partial [Blastochloris sp.]|nr:hypothetical protein [Blastochloris sp.]
NDNVLAALKLAQSIRVRDEYVRALTMIAPILVAAGHTQTALKLVQEPEDDNPEHQFTPVQQSRYMAVVRQRWPIAAISTKRENCCPLCGIRSTTRGPASRLPKPRSSTMIHRCIMHLVWH